MKKIKVFKILAICSLIFFSLSLYVYLSNKSFNTRSNDSFFLLVEYGGGKICKGKEYNLQPLLSVFLKSQTLREDVSSHFNDKLLLDRFSKITLRGYYPYLHISIPSDGSEFVSDQNINLAKFITSQFNIFLHFKNSEGSHSNCSPIIYFNSLRI